MTYYFTNTRLYLEYRLVLIEILLTDLKIIKLFGITADFWKNILSSDSYLTVSLNYNKDRKRTIPWS